MIEFRDDQVEFHDEDLKEFKAGKLEHERLKSNPAYRDIHNFLQKELVMVRNEMESPSRSFEELRFLQGRAFELRQMMNLPSDIIQLYEDEESRQKIKEEQNDS